LLINRSARRILRAQECESPPSVSPGMRGLWTTSQKPRSCPASARVDPMQQKSEPAYSLSAADQSGVLAIARSSWRRWRRQHIHTRATLLRPVQVLDHHSQRTPPPSACAAEAGGCWLLSSADQSTPQLTDQPARRDAAARCTPPRRQQPSHTAVPLLIAGFCRELGLRGPRFDDWVLPLPSPLVAFVAGFACVRQAGQGSPLRAFRGVFGLVQSVYLLRGVGDEQASRRRRSPPAGW